MYKRKEITTAVEGLNEQLKLAFDKFIDNRSAYFLERLEGDFDTVFATVKNIRSGIEAVAKGTSFDDVRMSGFFSTMLPYTDGDKLSYIELSIKSRLKATVPYKVTRRIDINEDILTVMRDMYRGEFIQLLYIEYAVANLNEVNSLLVELCQQAGTPYTFEFTLNENYIKEITDTKVVYGANIEKALSAATLTLFNTNSSFEEYLAEQGRDNLVKQLGTLQTTPQLIRANLDIVQELTGMKTHKRSDRLIRLSYHKKAQYLGNTKRSIGYFSDNVEIDGETVSVFALVGKDDNGEIVTVLSPFDVRTNFNVDFDVVSAVKKQLATV